jgi:MFS-type transporter involved in bile tolerance (Atg22 family)
MVTALHATTKEDAVGTALGPVGAVARHAVCIHLNLSVMTKVVAAGLLEVVLAPLLRAAVLGRALALSSPVVTLVGPVLGEVLNALNYHKQYMGVCVMRQDARLTITLVEDLPQFVHLLQENPWFQNN